MILVLVPNDTVKLEGVRQHLLNTEIKGEAICDVSTDSEIAEPLRWGLLDSGVFSGRSDTF